MNLRGIANRTIQTVNPNEPVTILRSTGYTIGAGARQVPTYANGENAYGQIQAMDGDALKQTDGMNLQGVIRTIYITGKLSAVSRPSQTGGDIIERGDERWLVVKVLETWPLWTKAVIVLQEDTAS